MAQEIVFRVDRFTKIVLVLIAVFLGILVFKPYFQAREVVAQRADVIEVWLHSASPDGLPISVRGDLGAYLSGQVDIRETQL